MSAECKGKYEVLKVIRANVLQGLEAYGFEGWNCAEADQPAIKNMDRVITLKFLTMKRIGWQNVQELPDKDNPGKFVQVSKWIEEQEWEVKSILNRKTEKVTEDTKTAEDAIYALSGWFNSMGVEVFRANGMGNLFVQNKDIKTYSDKSDVSQNSVSFHLKIHVPKKFVIKYPEASVRCEGMYPI